MSCARIPESIQQRARKGVASTPKSRASKAEPFAATKTSKSVVDAAHPCNTAHRLDNTIWHTGYKAVRPTGHTIGTQAGWYTVCQTGNDAVGLTGQTIWHTSLIVHSLGTPAKELLGTQTLHLDTQARSDTHRTRARSSRMRLVSNRVGQLTVRCEQSGRVSTHQLRSQTSRQTNLSAAVAASRQTFDRRVF